jgi:hypothetical protein
MGYMAGDYMAGGYMAGDYMAGGIFSALAGVVKGAAKGFALGGPLGAIAGARAGLPAPKPHGTNPSNLPAVIPRVGETALQGFVRRGGHLTHAGHAKAIIEHNAALQPKMLPPGHMMGFGRRRHMNWANPRAAARAERRIHALVKHMSKYVRWVHPARPGHLVPKFGKHKARKR